MSENIMEGLKTDNAIANETDSLGGFTVLDSGVYPSLIAKAFLSVSAKSGARAFNLHVKTSKGMLSQQFWVTSGKDKGYKNYYIDKRSGDKKYLPGFNMANAVCLLTIGKELSDLTAVEGVEEIYGQKEKVVLLPELAAQNVTLGVVKQIVDKTKYNEGTKEYEPTGETRQQNEVDKVFKHGSNLTTTEIRAGIDVPKFHEDWAAKWNGAVVDKSTKAASGAQEGAPAPAPDPAQTPAVTTTDLFK
jgi:hypothetical protein